jgi:hypothetical protein
MRKDSTPIDSYTSRKRKFTPRGAALAGVAMLAIGGFNSPAAAATTYGTLGNFDAVNDTGKVAHGFEIDLEGISVSDVTDVFGGQGRYFPPTVERYGAPTITENASHTGVVVRYEATFNNATKAWNVGTPSGVVTTSGESCWTGGGGGYGAGTPCDHFGVGTTKMPTSTTYSWLTETAPNSPILNNVSPSLPAPVQVVTPPAPPAPGQPAQQPKVQGVVQAQAPEGGNVFGVPEWVKVFTTTYDHPVALEDLVGGKNGLAPQNPGETEIEWQLLQTEAGNPQAGLLESPDQQAGAGVESVLRRYEFYKYTGQYEGVNGVPTYTYDGSQALSDVAVTGPGGNVGSFIGDQNLGVNLNGVYNGPPVAAVPEPSTWAMMLLGLAGAAFAGRRAKNRLQPA